MVIDSLETQDGDIAAIGTVHGRNVVVSFGLAVLGLDYDELASRLRTTLSSS